MENDVPGWCPVLAALTLLLLGCGETGAPAAGSSAGAGGGSNGGGAAGAGGASAEPVYCESLEDYPCVDGCTCSVGFNRCDDAGFRTITCREQDCRCQVDGTDTSNFQASFCGAPSFQSANQACGWQLTNDPAARATEVLRCEMGPPPLNGTTECQQSFSCPDGVERSVSCTGSACVCTTAGQVTGQFTADFCTAFFRQDNLGNQHCGWNLVSF